MFSNVKFLHYNRHKKQDKYNYQKIIGNLISFSSNIVITVARG